MLQNNTSGLIQGTGGLPTGSSSLPRGGGLPRGKAGLLQGKSFPDWVNESVDEVEESDEKIVFKDKGTKDFYLFIQGTLENSTKPTKEQLGIVAKYKKNKPLSTEKHWKDFLPYFIALEKRIFHNKQFKADNLALQQQANKRETRSSNKKRKSKKN